MELAAKTPKKNFRIPGISIYCIGFLLGVLFNALAVWGDLEGMAFWGTDEARTYDSTQPLDAKLNSVKCPLLLSTRETGTVSAVVSNPIETPIHFILQANISSPEEETGIRRDIQELQLGPGESQEISWTVTPKDRRYGRVILFRVYLYQRLTSGPARTAHCGILVSDQPGLSSSLIIACLLAASLLGVAVGGWLLAGESQPLKNPTRNLAPSLIFLTGTILAGMIANLAGAWLLAGGLLVLTVLTLLAVFEAGSLPRKS